MRGPATHFNLSSALGSAIAVLLSGRPSCKLKSHPRKAAHHLPTHKPAMYRKSSSLIFALSILIPGFASAQVVALPGALRLDGSGASSSVLIQQKIEGPDQSTLGGQVAEVEFTIDDESVAKVVAGKVVAVSDGKTTLHAKTLRGETQTSVEVVNAGAPRDWQFEAHIQSVLSRQGCNSGACHGALAGKGGFKLSLRGYDSELDHFTITQEARGRRITPEDPGRSLVLAKPTMLIPHKGGARLEEGDLNYRILADWIAAGSPGPSPEDASLVRVEVLPAATRLQQGAEQQLIVRAFYSDGRVDDVTHWAKFSATNEAVANVTEDGRVAVVGHGKGAVVAWFGSQIAISSVVVPYEQAVGATSYRDFRPVNLIDEILLEEWQALNLAPSPGCSDETFLRRAYLDTTGTIPTPAQVRDFMGDTRADRRSQLIERLLNGESYVDYWAYLWSDLLLVNGNLLRPDAVAAFYTWIREQVEQNRPWDAFARDVVLARGESLDQGATNFYAIHQTPEALTENTCQAFLGLSIACAKCHNHPLEKWTNDQYYAMANMFSRVRAKGWGGDARNGDGKRTLVVLERGELIQPSTGKPQPPAALDQQPIAMDSTRDRREALAEWLISPENPYFARAIANRVWANYMGVGLVESVDDLRASNPPSSPRLLDALAEHLRKHSYDLKALSRLILNSATYQRAAEALPTNQNDERFYCRYYPRRLMAEVLHDAIVSVTGVPTTFSEVEFQGADRRKTDFYEEGTRSIELYDSSVVNYFLKTFGRHQRRITCDCERSDQPTVVQVLHLNNGDTLNEKLADEACVIQGWLKDETPADQIVDEAYLSSLSRRPSSAERRRVLKLIADADAAGVPRQESYEDLLWSLMTSREFLFAH